LCATGLCGGGRGRNGARRGGPAGCSEAMTGLGVKAGGGSLSKKECSGTSPTVTGTVCGRKPGLENETAWLSGGTASEQGVWQV